MLTEFSHSRHQVEEGLDSPLRVDSPEPDELSEDSGVENDDINALADILNEDEDEENGNATPEVKPAPSVNKSGRRGRPSVGGASASAKKTFKAAAKRATVGGSRGRPRGGGVPKHAKTPTKGSRSSARVQEIAERPVLKEPAAAFATKVYTPVC